MTHQPAAPITAARTDTLAAGPEPAPPITLRKRLRLFVQVVAIVLVLSLAKALIHWAGLEFLSINPLFSSAIAGAVFIIGFLLSSVLSDYKEADRMPADMRVALEAIRGDAASFAETHPQAGLADIDARLERIVEALEAGLDEGDRRDLHAAADAVAGLSPAITRLEGLGMPANYIVRLRQHQDALRKTVFRIMHIQRLQFVPSAYVLVQSLVALNLFLLLFLTTEGSPESALIFGFIAYMFVYALHLIGTLEQPFRKGRNSVDDVSLFLLRDYRRAPRN